MTNKVNNLKDIGTPIANSIINQIQQSADTTERQWYECVKPQQYERYGGEAFPLECLTQTELNAVNELSQGYGYSIELIQSQTLAAMTAAFTLCARIEADGRESPVSVNTLTIAGSSEGKTTIHNLLVLRVLNAIVDAKEKALKEDNLNYDINLKQWEQISKSIETSMSNPRIKNHSELREKYSEHLKMKPIKPPQWEHYRAAHGFSTQGLASHLLEFPICVVSCDEGLEALGSHAFNREEIHRTIGVLNSLFSGGAYNNTIKSEPVHIEHCNGVINLMVQPHAFQKAFLLSRGNLAKDSGLCSRFEICYPTSIAGTVDHSKRPPVDFPSVDKFCERIIDIAVETNTVQLKDNDHYVLNAPVIHCGVEATKLWVEYKQKIEPWMLADLGRYCGLGEKEAVGKSAELALRIAAVMHILEHPQDYSSRCISEGTMRKAILRAEWYLHEGIRALKSLEIEHVNSLPRIYEKALLEACRDNKTGRASLTQVKNIVRNHSRELRDGSVRDDAMQMLFDLNRAAKFDGKTTYIEPHPDILNAFNC